jgi:hypothetical protein
VNPHDILKYADRTFRSAIGSLEPDDWRRVVAGVWTPKDVVGHVTTIHLLSVNAIAALAGREALVAEQGLADDVDYNMSQAAVRDSWPVERVIGEYETVASELEAMARNLNADTWRRVGTIPWYGAEYSLEDYIVYRVYGHVREHATHLGMATDLRTGAVGGG